MKLKCFQRIKHSDNRVNSKTPGALPPGSLPDHTLSKPVHFEHLVLAELLRLRYLRCGEKWFSQMHTTVPSQCPVGVEIFSQTQVEM